MLGVKTLKRIAFVPNVVFLVHDLPGVFTLKHDMSLKPDTRLPGVQTLKRIVFVPNVVFLVHDLLGVFTLKHDMPLKPDTRLPGVHTLKHFSSKYSFI